MDRTVKITLIAMAVFGLVCAFLLGRETTEEKHEEHFEEVLVEVTPVAIGELKIEKETYEDRVVDSADTDNRDDYTEPQTTKAEEEVHPIGVFTEEEIWEMARIVYLENGIVSESTDTTLYLTACVLLNRLYDWNYSTIYDVIFDAGQYSTANQYEDYDGSALGSYGEGWSRSYNAVCTAIENTDRNPHFQSTFAQGEVYYVDPNTGETFCY